MSYIFSYFFTPNGGGAILTIMGFHFRDPFEDCCESWNMDLISKLKQEARDKPQTNKMIILFERKISICVYVTRFEVFKSVVILIFYMGIEVLHLGIWLYVSFCIELTSIILSALAR